MPKGTANGPAELELTDSEGRTARVNIQIENVAPGLFSADASGRGPAAATYLRIGGDGTRIEGFTFSLEGNRPNEPIALGPESDQIYISFYGTGFRAQQSVSALFGETPVPVFGAVAQGQFDGLDQAVVGPLPRTLAGAGELEVTFTFDDVMSNAVTIAIE
jgi:uncharacterized protein (TIGR03437 family)